MNADTMRYAWECPGCGKTYRVKAGYRPTACPKCRERGTYREEDLPERPEWMQKRARKKSAFVQTSNPRAFHVEDEVDPADIEVYEPPKDTSFRRKRRDLHPALLAYLWWCAASAAIVMTTGYGDWQTRVQAGNALSTIVPITLIAYMLPSIIAFNRYHHNFAPIMVVNVVFGWTLIGYVASLAWSLRSRGEVHHRYHHE